MHTELLCGACQEHGIWAWDSELQELVLVIPSVLAMLGDNPMQSEFACHIGFRGKFFCRVCWAKGDPDREDDETDNAANSDVGSVSSASDASSANAKEYGTDRKSPGWSAFIAKALATEKRRHPSDDIPLIVMTQPVPERRSAALPEQASSRPILPLPSRVFLGPLQSTSTSGRFQTSKNGYGQFSQAILYTPARREISSEFAPPTVNRVLQSSSAINHHLSGMDGHILNYQQAAAPTLPAARTVTAARRRRLSSHRRPSLGQPSKIWALAAVCHYPLKCIKKKLRKKSENLRGGSDAYSHNSARRIPPKQDRLWAHRQRQMRAPCPRGDIAGTLARRKY
ncbi:hypothetical protein B0H17DRAFT_1123529 [Mycena rosella]|uniref:Uncharacterized protein n=1 Tax=Mycena rosella TaxID=1033263 RepID=A0AAD7MCC5_MYCRO|nr:hypothetical protein B0H17DRAFT_1123529 [Mycena rosella]